MLQRIIAIWLALSILGYGVALAADVHGEQQYDAGYSTADTTPNPGHGDHAGCGHCAHGAAHLTGLECSLPALSSLERGVVPRNDYRPALRSPALRTPLRPPTFG